MRFLVAWLTWKTLGWEWVYVKTLYDQERLRRVHWTRYKPSIPYVLMWNERKFLTQRHFSPCFGRFAWAEPEPLGEEENIYRIAT